MKACICPMVSYLVYENTKQRDSASKAKTKFDCQSGRYEPSSPSTKELHESDDLSSNLADVKLIISFTVPRKD